MRSFRPAVLLIVTVLAACDNVQWGGADLHVVPPPPPSGMTEIEPDAQEFMDLGLPRAPVLFHVTRGERGATLLPVAELSGDTLRAIRRPAGVSPEAYESRFREAVLQPGAQYTLFRRGAPVGSFTVQGQGPITACGVPTATGTVTAVAAATDVSEFLAFQRGLGPDIRGDYNPPQITGSIRRYASIVAERLVLQAGLPRPRSWPGAQRDLQAIDVIPGGEPEMATTYLSGDRLGIGAAEPGGYSVFYIADFEIRRGYQPLYSEVRNYDKAGGKSAPRVVDYLDFSGKEEQEILVQVYGPTQSWYEMIHRDGRGRWVKGWQGQPCPGGATPPAR
ncbi:hypothetical protein BH20GEM3_BH20GEM3_14670 [soil metagenome]